MKTLQKASHRVGLGRFPNWNAMSIQDLAYVQPQVAVAKLWGVEWAPYLLNLRASFTDLTTTTLAPVGFENGNGQAVITQPSIVDSIAYEIDAPNSFTGDIFKPLHDYYYQLQSGIQATLTVVGAPRYTIAPFPTPLRTLLDSLAEGWPIGWILNYTESVSMIFSTTTPLETAPTNITVTFRMWTPSGTTSFQMMSAGDARQILANAGYAVETPPTGGQNG